MNAAVRALVRVSGAIGARWPEAELRPLLVEAKTHAPALEVEEALVQSYLFVGYPGALRALAVWREVAGPAVGTEPESDPSTWPERGETVCREVYGHAYDRLRENIRALHPGLGEWMLTEGYGKVLGRPGLALRVRELCIAALLAAQGATEQLYSHLRGALRVGASAEDVSEMLETVTAMLDEERSAAAREVWAAVRARAESAG